MAIYFPSSSIQEISSQLNVSGGTIIQMIEVRSTNTYAAANWSTQNELFTGSITPTSTSSKILIYVHGTFRMDVAPVNWSLSFFWLHNTTRNVNVITCGWNGTTRNVIGSLSRQYLDSPNSTATQTYSFRVGNYPTGTCYWNNTSQSASDGYAYLRLMEISA